MTDKYSLVSKGFTTANWSVLDEELAKCELVCANCHRVRTVQRMSELQGVRT